MLQMMAMRPWVGGACWVALRLTYPCSWQQNISSLRCKHDMHSSSSHGQSPSTPHQLPVRSSRTLPLDDPVKLHGDGDVEL